MPNLSGANPSLTTSNPKVRRHDPIDESLKLAAFSGISASNTAATGIALKAEKIGPYLAVVCYNGHEADGSKYWTVNVTGADNSSFTNEVTLGSIKLLSGSSARKEYLALNGAAVASLMAAASEGEAVYVRATATKTSTPGNLTGQVYLTSD
jgi:hypothetical protein